MLEKRPVEGIQKCQAYRSLHWPHLDKRLRELGYLVGTEECPDDCTLCRRGLFAQVLGRYSLLRAARRFLRGLRKRIPTPPWGR